MIYSLERYRVCEVNGMNNITQDDLVFLLGQDQGQLDIIASGMTAIINDTEGKCLALQNQNWAKRMFATVLGVKNAKSELIRAKAATLRAYCAEALTALFDHQKISDAVVFNLGAQMNEIFNSSFELRHTTGTLAKKLDEKIEGLDRYYTFSREIELGRFGGDGNIFWLYRTIAEIDGQTLRDARKMELLSSLLYDKQIVSKDPISADEFVMWMLGIPENHVGAVYMELMNYPDSITAGLAMAAIERWHFKSRSNKQYLKKEKIMNQLLKEFEIEPGVEISPELEYQTMIESKTIRISAPLDREIERQEREQEHRERQQEIQAAVAKNMQGLQTTAKKGMRSLGGFFGSVKTKLMSLPGKLRKAEAEQQTQQSS